MTSIEQSEQHRQKAAVASPATLAFQGRLLSERIMGRVRAEMERVAYSKESDLRGILSEDVDRSPITRWSPSSPRLPYRKEYALAELLSFSDVDFVEQCYQIVLQRQADADGLHHFLEALRRGESSKVEIIGDIRFSPEGMSRGVHIDGLLLPYTLRRWMKKPWIGRPLRWLHGFARLDALVSRQSAIDAAQARETHMLGQSINRIVDVVEARIRQGERRLEVASESFSRELSGQSSGISAIMEKFEALHVALEQAEVERNDIRQEFGIHADHIMHALKEELEMIASLGPSREALVEIHQDIENLNDRVEIISRRIDEGEAQSKKFEDLIDQQSTHASGLSARIDGLVMHFEKKNAEQQSAEIFEQDRAHALDGLYAAFEDSFRGSRELIRLRLEPYLEWIREVGAGSREAPVLDIGSGRGEWLELLRDHQLVGRGIDLNRVFVDICHGRGLDVECSDALVALRNMADASVGAVTSIHLVEHLPYEVLIAMIDEIKRVLRPGGLILLETPNPENIMVGACNFYIDPTHRNPIPPEALRWTVQARGFHAARIERLTHGREVVLSEDVAVDVPGAAAVNAMSRVFSAPPDYAVVAIRL